jgi:hypothetical protein
MYAHWTLDCVVDTAVAVSNDYVKRAGHYPAIPVGVRGSLSSLRVQLGKATNWPDANQRAAMFTPILGLSEANPTGGVPSQVQVASEAVREAAEKYLQRQVAASEPALRMAFCDALQTLNIQLQMFAGDALNSAAAETGAVFGVAANVLREAGVASAFGPRGAPPAGWPFPAYANGNGAALIEAITNSPPNKGITAQRFLLLQKVAYFGADTIGAAWHYDGTTDIARIAPIIEIANRWKTALDQLKGK